MDKTTIRAMLDDALAIVRSGAPSQMALTIALYEADTASPKAISQFVSLLAALRAEPALADFNGKMQVVPGGAHRLEYRNLAAWLMSRAISASSDRVLNDLEQYLTASELPCELTVAVTGVHPEASFDLGKGISLIPWDALRDSHQKQAVFERFALGGLFHLPQAAIVRGFAFKKTHVSQEAFQHDIEAPMKYFDETELHDALMCIAMVGPFAPHVVASWISVPEWAPMIGGGMTLPLLEGFTSSKPYPADASEKGKLLFTLFTDLPASFQARLRLVMQRLIRAMRRGVPVDASIDLGIALEALYLSDMPDDRGELTFRLRTRAARFLGTTEVDRKRIFGLVGDLYAIRSSAVHTGSVGPTFRGKPVQEVLEQGFALTADTASRFISHGQPNWDTVMFG